MLFTSRFPMRSFHSLPPLLVELPVLGGEKVEQQAVVQAPVDHVALPLSADKAEAEAFYGPDRRVMGNSPGIDRVKAKIVERKGHEPRTGDGRIPPVAEGFLSGRPPKRRSHEGAIHIVQSDDPDGSVVPIRRIRPHEMRFPLRHDLEKGGRDDLSSVPQIQPLVVLFLREPARDPLENFSPVERQQLHVAGYGKRYRTPAPPAAGGTPAWDHSASLTAQRLGGSWRHS